MTLYFFADEEGRFVARDDHGQIVLADPIRERNEITSLLHSTARARAEEWLTWMNSPAGQAHGKRSPGLDLTRCRVVSFQEITGG